MLLTYKIKHNRDFSEELQKARMVAEFCIKHRTQNLSLDSPPTQKSVSCDYHFPVSPLHSQQLGNYEKNQKKMQRKRTKVNSTSVPDSFLISDSLHPGDVKHIGLKSTLSGPILRKYSRNKDLRSVKNVKLIIPSQAVSALKKEKTLIIPCLKLLLNYHFSNNFNKISQIEIDHIYAYVAVVFPSEEPKSSEHYIGIDRNTRGHIAVVANPESGKIWKLGKMRYHTHKKYENIKKRLYNTGRYEQLKAVKNREKNIINNLNHQISRKIVNIALYNGCGIKLEDLNGLRKLNSKIGGAENGEKNKHENKKRKQKRDKSREKKINKKAIKNKSKILNYTCSSEYSLNSWSFHQLHQFIEYKARLLGVEVAYIDPHATSKRCSRCGHTGNRHSKQFECPHCGHVDHADVNAAFNIALTPKSNDQFSAERDVGKGDTDTPLRILDRAIFGKRIARKETSPQFAWEVCQFLA